jgi:hypothetical protein
MKEEVKELIEKTEQIKDYKKIISKINKDIKTLNGKIKEWMENNDKETITYQGMEIRLVDKHISQSFKKEVIQEKLMEELNVPSEQCEQIADRIINNKKFIVKKVLKVKENK